MRFKIVTAGWNSADYLDLYFESVGGQVDVDYDVCIVDDCSDDKRQPERIASECKARGWKYILKDKKVGGVRNQYDAIVALNPDPEDVLVFVDLDDGLHGFDALKTLSGYYERDPELRLTYGSYKTSPRSRTCRPASSYDPAVVSKGSYRAEFETQGQRFNHLRTFKYELFQHMDLQDFQWPDGTWLQVAQDLVFMIPALELAGRHHTYLSDKLYVYRSDNPLSDWRRNARDLQRTIEYVLSLTPKRPLKGNNDY